MAVARMVDEIDTHALALAKECADGVPHALEEFEQRCMGGALDRVLMRLGAAPAEVDELKQRVRLKLLVAEPDRRARITDYTGRGPLEGWVRVIAVRELLDLRKREKNEIPMEEDAIIAIALPSVDPELEHVKQRYAAEFRTAFKETLRELEARDRTVLRYNALDGLSIDEIGRLYGVHRASAARWLVKARTALLEGTRARLMTRLDVSPEELDSILRLIQSELDASLGSSSE
jgi:RNA polymerase sigma-70 factor (ECF subfamily)